MPQVEPHISGRAYWRSLEEYADTPQFRELLGLAGQPVDAEQAAGGLSRRRFLQLMGASMSLAGLTLAGCRRWPEQTLAPYANRPEGRMPGEPVHYASQFELGGVARGVLVESFDGRPTKLEGNPQHPFSLGATDAWTQASVLNLYDPDRSRWVTSRASAGGAGQRSEWANFQTFLREHMAQQGRGERFAVLAEPSDSPSRAAMRQRLSAALPAASWYEWAPLHRDNSRAGAKLAFGKPVRAMHHLDKAEVLACFDADPLLGHPASLRYARDWSQARRVDEGRMNRVYVAEPSFSIIGSVADERLATKASNIPTLVRALAAKLGVVGGEAGSLNGATAFIDRLAADLRRLRGKALVIVGESQPAETHALAWAINQHLGAIGQTVTLLDARGDEGPALTEQIAEVTRRAAAGEIDTLVILGGNPVYDAPADLAFAEALAKVPTSIHLSAYQDETSLACRWHLPMSHALEGWGDGRAWDGTLSIQQPLILPLYDGKSPIELLALLLGEAPDGYAIVRRTFAEQFTGGGAFEPAWRKVLHDGLLEGSGYEVASVTVSSNVASLPAPAAAVDGYELVLTMDPSLYDGRFANNGWLQELPGPLTKLTWDNAALISPADAKALGVSTGGMLSLTVDGRTLEVPAMLMPGQARGSIALALGYGRTASGHVGNKVGFDAYPLRTTAAPHVAAAQVAKAGGTYTLATTTNHDLIDAVGEYAVRLRAGERGESGLIVKEATYTEYQHNEVGLGGHGHGDIPLQLFEPPSEFNDPHAWGMAIDMNACIGCNACVVACQAENNVPVVGKDQVLVNREMHWLRIDRYYKGDPDTENGASPDVVHQPVTCVHCENAPCEQVCPVNASVHDSEGLNLQVYNRCIGTRYCSNNCPYKVRRFNYFDFHAKDPRGAAKPWLLIPDMQQDDPSQIDLIKRMVFNPDVTVRMRGVMEKCTYCVQRIKRAEITAKNDWAQGERAQPLVADGEVITACQQACPTQAIVFGNLNDPESRVSRMQRSRRAYGLLEDLNTRPRTHHLAKIRNPVKT